MLFFCHTIYHAEPLGVDAFPNLRISEHLTEQNKNAYDEIHKQRKILQKNVLFL
jgi:hypothetical protein